MSNEVKKSVRPWGVLKPLEQNNYNRGNPKDGRHYWLTPPDLLQRIKAEFGDDLYDPCPYPKPPDYDGLTADWGKTNYANPPFGSFMGQDGKKKGMTAWVRKAIEEQEKGKTSIIVFPQHAWLHMLVKAGAEFRSLGNVDWLSTEEPQSSSSASSPIMMFILRGKTSEPGTTPAQKSERPTLEPVVTVCTDEKSRN
jgi:hypothetical protein